MTADLEFRERAILLMAFEEDPGVGLSLKIMLLILLLDGFEIAVSLRRQEFLTRCDPGPISLGQLGVAGEVLLARGKRLEVPAALGYEHRDGLPSAELDPARPGQLPVHRERCKAPVGLDEPFE